MAKFKALPFLLLATSLAVQFITVPTAAQMLDSDNNLHMLVKRQANNRKRDETSSNNNDRLDQVGPGGGNGKVTAVSVISSVSSVGGGGPSTLATSDEAGTPPNQPVGSAASASSGRPKVRPKQFDGPVNTASDLDDNIEVARPNRRRRPTRTRRPVDSYDGDRGRNRDDRGDRDDEDCDEYDRDDYEYGANLFQMATKPMRQFSNMMGNVFDQMQGMASGDFDDYQGTNFAIASSRSGNDGYSRVSSISNNNGRTRGIISETRNGRTSTRRIGDDNDDNASDY